MSAHPSSMSRRRFLAAAAAGGAGAAWLGGAHVVLRDARWTPNRSFWVARGRAPLSPPPSGDADVDLAIVGGGVTGLSTAVHALTLAPSLKVALLEAHFAGYGATGRSGGVLGDGTEMGTPEGTEDNVAHVLGLIDRFGIDCDLEREPETQLDPYKYAVGLKRAAVGLGATVHESARVAAIRPGPPAEIRGDGFRLRATRVVVATNGYTPRLGIAVERLFPVHTGAAVTAPLPPALLATLPGSIHVMTSREMYMWGRKAPGGRLLVGAGARYTYDNGLWHGGEAALFRALNRFLWRTFPPLRGQAFEHAWTGPMGCTTDQEPIIGAIAPGIHFCGGYTGHGLAMGTKAGLFLARLAIDGTAPPAWLLRGTLPLPGEPLRYIGVNAAINLMNLGVLSMAKHA